MSYIGMLNNVYKLLACRIQSCGLGRTCVAYYQCINGTINTAGEGLLDSRFGELDDIRYCKGVFETCCTIPNS